MKDNIRQTIIVLALMVSIFFLGGVLLYGESIQSDANLTFNVIGINNMTNSSSLTELHYECIKYCINKQQSDYNRLNNCYEQCASLGKEGCE